MVILIICTHVKILFFIVLEHMQPLKESFTAKYTSNSCSNRKATMMKDLVGNSTKQSGLRKMIPSSWVLLYDFNNI